MRRKRHQDPEPDRPLAYLQNLTHRVRSKRPLMHQTAKISISTLKELDMLRVGENTRLARDRDLTFFTRLAGKRTTFTYRMKDRSWTVGLESRRRGSGLTWYFVDPEQPSRLARSLLLPINPEIVDQRPPLYASQFQSKTYRQFLQMEKLILFLDADGLDVSGRGQRKAWAQKLVHLQRIYKEVSLSDNKREKLFRRFPQFERTFEAAKKLLRRKIPKISKQCD